MNKTLALWLSVPTYVALLIFATSLMVENFDPSIYPYSRWPVAFAWTFSPCLFIGGAFFLWKIKLRSWAKLFAGAALGIVIAIALNNIQTLDKGITKAQGAITIAQSHKKALEAERNSLQAISDANEQKVSCTLITLSNGSTRQACNDPNKDLREQKKNAREKIAQINAELPTFDEEIAKQQKYIEDNDGRNARMAFFAQLIEILLSTFIGLILAYGGDPKDDEGPKGPKDTKGEQPSQPPKPSPLKYLKHNVPNIDKLLSDVSSMTRKQWSRLYPRHNVKGLDELLHAIGQVTQKQWKRLYPRHNVQNVDKLLNEAGLTTRQQWTKPKPNEAEKVLEDLEGEILYRSLAQEKPWKQ